MAYFLFWIVIGATMCIAEIFVPTFFLFWFGLGGFAAGVVSLFFGLVPQIVTFTLVSFFLLIFTRPIAVRVLLRGDSPKKINIDDMIGKRALVLESIDPFKGTGKVKINGEIWRAVSENGEKIESESYVSVVKVDGTKLLVRKEGNS